MNGQTATRSRCFLISVAVHALLVSGAFFLGAQAVGSEDPIVVFLAPDPVGGGGGGSPTRQEAPAPKARDRRETVRKINRPRSLSRPFKKLPDATPPVAAPAFDESSPVVAQAAPQDVGPASPPANTTAGEGTGSGPGRGSGSGTGWGPGTGSGVGTGEGRGMGEGSGESREDLKRRYLTKNFAYIRDLIFGHLAYPAMARKLGWQGGVTVSFTIREDGHTEKTRIVRSSGYDILDRNVLDTIREVQPFPRPPIKAELVIPIVYRLE